MDPLHQFRQDTEPDAAAFGRVRRLTESRLQRPASVPWLGIGLAAAALLVVFLLLPGQAPTPKAVVADTPISVATLDASQKSLSTVDGKVKLDWQGSGHLSGTNRAPSIDWDSGHLSVEVEPQQGIALSVQTREATVRVVGTGFSVHRDVLGTRVEVRHGKVQVECSDGSSVLIGESQSRLCMPSSGVGLLARARALQSAEMPATEVLTTVELGLNSKDLSESVRDELQVLQVQELEAVGRKEEAKVAAERYLASPNPPRAVEMHRYAAALAGEADCASALPHLEYLRDHGPDVDDLQRYAQCKAPSDKKEARRALETALKMSDTGEQRAVIQASLAALGKAD